MSCDNAICGVKKYEVWTYEYYIRSVFRVRELELVGEDRVGYTICIIYNIPIRPVIFTIQQRITIDILYAFWYETQIQNQ
jgi:hypothetical protein